MEKHYIENIQHTFLQYRALAEKAMAQVEEKRLFWAFNNESNSIAIIVQHVSGNMISRFTNFYEEDGEKTWRDRDREFEGVLTTRAEVMEAWNNGWNVFLKIIQSLEPADLHKTVTIRGQAHTVVEALQRQLAHYSYHIGQIVFLSKMVAQDSWNSLSIPKNQSDDFNRKMTGK